jgi:hypothetical protein
VTYPDERTTVYTDFDAKTNAPTATTRPDQEDQTQTLHAYGQPTTTQGAGVLTRRLGYNPLTGQSTALTTFRSGGFFGRRDSYDERLRETFSTQMISPVQSCLQRLGSRFRTAFGPPYFNAGCGPKRPYG